MKTTHTFLFLGLAGLLLLNQANAQSQPDANEAAHQRLAAKVQSAKEGYHKWAASGRDPSVISQLMHEKVKPLLNAGKFVEAEAELDRVLERLNSNTEPQPTSPAAPAPGTANTAEPSSASGGETKYLAFQVQTGLPGYASQFHRPPGRFSLTKPQMEEFVHSVAKAIGSTGDARHKLAFAVGPLCFDMPDEETRQFIRDAFAVARENDVAVAFHIDDSMGWGERQDLISNPDNIETADWQQIPNTGRRMDWGLKPMKFAPQMCFNAPAIVAAVKQRGTLIGAEVKKEMNVLKSAGKEHLFAGLIAGWETRIGRDFDTDRPLGHRALSHRGFSESNPPKDADQERVLVVKEFIELWAHALHEPGVPDEKIYCHIAFTAQGLDHKEKTETVSTFALPEVAFGSGYRPGFSTYPSGKAFKEIWGHVAAHGSPAWISAEGTNVAPGTGMSSGITMETYLGRMFNHGAVMVNIFAWGIGGEAMRTHFFRRAAEDPEPLAAYGKFLRGEVLNESDPSGFSVEMLEAKVHRIQAGLPAWIQKTGRQSEAMPLMKQMQSLMKERKWQEVDKVADEILSLVSSTAKSNNSTPGTAGAQDEEARKHFLHELGGPFFVSRDKVQEELKLSDDQKLKLRETMTG